MNHANSKIRERVLRGIALNRRPGLHFPGNFLDLSFDRIGRDRSVLSFAPGPWCVDADGQADLGAMAIVADMALAACMRANLKPHERLATVNMQLQFTGASRTGALRASGEFQGFLAGAAGKQGFSRVSVMGAKGQVCYGIGSFMALSPPKGVTLHPVPYRKGGKPEPRRLGEHELDAAEKKILAAADAAIAAGGSFIRNFWGPRDGRLTNGLHAGNRVGHAQGGLLIGMAASNAAALLPPAWRLSGVSAWYISPGEGQVLKAASTIVHHGRLTAVVRTIITGKNRRRVLEVVSSHYART